MSDEAHRLDCLARWAVEHHGGDGQRIAAWFERIKRVRDEWRRWHQARQGREAQCE